ncbi:hypothetical protein ACLB2K_011574 [Fragaria x ananassa]
MAYVMIYTNYALDFGGAIQMRKTGDLGNAFVFQSRMEEWGWRLLQNLTSSITRLYKALYYPKGDFIKAQLGTTPFSWRSILEAREVLVQGLRWQVRSGEKIDKWIPDIYPRCPSSPQSGDAPQLVSELINHFTRRWDQEKLERFFTPAVVDLILGIPLSTRVSGDCQIWHCHKKRIFTTNSAYHVARDIALGLVLAPTPPPDPHTGLWKARWNSKTISNGKGLKYPLG